MSTGRTTLVGGIARRATRLLAGGLAAALACAAPGAAGQPTPAAPAAVSIFPLEPAWTTDFGQPAAAEPGYDDVHAYVPLRDGTLVAVRLLDGETVWTVRQPTGFPPAVAVGNVIVADGATLVARWSTTGRARWGLDFAAPISAPPFLAGGWLFVSLANGELVTLRAADGGELWRRALDGPLRVRPSVGGRRLFVPIDDGRLAALDLATGAPLWERALPGNPRQVLPLDGVFVGATDNHLYRLSPTSGATRWRWRAGGDVVGAPAADESRIFFTSLDNILWALDRASGVQQWRRLLPGRPRAGPAIRGRALFVSGVSERLHVFESGTGEPAGVLSARDELGAPPHLAASLAAAGLRLVLLVADGHLVGLRTAFGPPQLALGFPPPPLLPAPARFTPADVLPFERPAARDAAAPAAP